ncbi:Flp family type IVb pilin [Pinisolibacter sp.]|uniref:Flp family type IVb pilin n=1 Tax=Pinisolibacter sp. TaxID=2172024 RepID=UPI002FDE7A84
MGITTRIERLRATTRALMSDDAGSTSMEYGLVGTLVSLAIIASLSATGTGVADKWNAFANTINSYLR